MNAMAKQLSIFDLSFNLVPSMHNVRLNQILDVTLRDGALGLGFQITYDQVIRYLTHVSAIGITDVECGFIGGPGKWHGVDPKSPCYHLRRDILDELAERFPQIRIVIDYKNRSGVRREIGRGIH